MKNDQPPIRDSVPWNSRTKDPRWWNNVFLFSSEIWAEQLKKHPVAYWFWHLVAGSDILLRVLMCLVTGRPIEQPFGQYSDQSTGLFGDEVTNWQIIATHLVLGNSRMAPRRMDKVQLDVALPPAGGKKSNFSFFFILKCALDTLLNHIR